MLKLSTFNPVLAGEGDMPHMTQELVHRRLGIVGHDAASPYFEGGTA